VYRTIFRGLPALNWPTRCRSAARPDVIQCCWLAPAPAPRIAGAAQRLLSPPHDRRGAVSPAARRGSSPAAGSRPTTDALVPRGGGRRDSARAPSPSPGNRMETQTGHYERTSTPLIRPESLRHGGPRPEHACLRGHRPLIETGPPGDGAPRPRRGEIRPPLDAGSASPSDFQVTAMGRAPESLGPLRADERRRSSREPAAGLEPRAPQATRPQHVRGGQQPLSCSPQCLARRRGEQAALDDVQLGALDSASARFKAPVVL